jgi:hypothetical protein
MNAEQTCPYEVRRPAYYQRLTFLSRHSDTERFRELTLVGQMVESELTRHSRFTAVTLRYTSFSFLE